MGILRHSGAALSAVIGAPVLAAGVLLRPSFRYGLGERLGGVTRSQSRRIHVHASSVGEAKAAARLLRRLRDGGFEVRGTTSTLGGRELLERELPEVPSSLAPLDHPWIIDRALRRAEPRLSVLIETELWPCWISTLAARGIPSVVVSGRLSDRSFPRYEKARTLIAPALGRLEAVGARTDLDAERFVALGVSEARVSVTGDLKLDPPDHQPTLAVDLIRAVADSPVVVGGSTHEGEEAALLDALDACEKEGQGFVLILGPRQVERAAEIRRLCRHKQRRVYLRSELEGRHLVPGEVLVLDSLGELAAIYATASVAFVGGTLAPVGGHNLVEPVHTGCPVLYGPRTENVRKVAQILEACGAGRRVADRAELSGALIESFDDLGACRMRGELGRETLDAHRGSVVRTISLIEEILARGNGSVVRDALGLGGRE